MKLTTMGNSLVVKGNGLKLRSHKPQGNKAKKREINHGPCSKYEKRERSWGRVYPWGLWFLFASHSCAPTPHPHPQHFHSPKHVPTTLGATEGLRYQPACASPALSLLRCHFHGQNLKRERLSCLLSYFFVQTSPAENLSSSEGKLTETNVPARAIALQLT